jgi:hypothetical protein
MDATVPADTILIRTDDQVKRAPTLVRRNGSRRC